MSLNTQSRKVAKCVAPERVHVHGVWADALRSGDLDKALMAAAESLQKCDCTT